MAHLSLRGADITALLLLLLLPATDGDWSARMRCWEESLQVMLTNASRRATSSIAYRRRRRMRSSASLLVIFDAYDVIHRRTSQPATYMRDYIFAVKYRRSI